jgi:ribosomal protein L9
MDNPSPEQIAECRKEFEKTEWPTELKREPSGYSNNYIEGVWQGYLRRCTEQATEIAELKALAANLKQEAQIHAMEARGANATINEINQFISGATGEPANWHGAQPVKEFVNELKAKLAEVMPLAKFGALVMDSKLLMGHDYGTIDRAIEAGLLSDEGADGLVLRGIVYKENIEATITKLLKD